MQAPDLLDRLHAAVRETPPRGLAANDVDAFVHRNRAVLLALIAERLADREPDLWTPAKRTKANLAAMEVLARGVTSAEDRRIVARYSGWGGLSLRPGLARQTEDQVQPLFCATAGVSSTGGLNIALSWRGVRNGHRGARAAAPIQETS